MRVAIFGGSFDPIHEAHLSIIKKLFDELNMDKVIVIPTNVSYYKKNRAMFTYKERVELCKNAILNDDYLKTKNIEISNIEEDIKDDEGYAHTLLKISKILPNTELFTVVGSDSYNYINKWRSYELIFELSKVIVVCRPNYEIDNNIGYDYIKLEMNLDISSTKIREEIIRSKHERTKD